MRGDPTHTQPSEEELIEERLIRRLVLEAIIPLAQWAGDKDVLTRSMIEATCRKHSLYEQGRGWQGVLEEFCQRKIEALRSPKPTDWPALLAKGKHPALERIQEMGRAAQDCLLVCWHPREGAITAAPGSDERLRNMLGVITHLETTTKSIPVDLWGWDKRNFTNHGH
jgi:hypothetical protein